jgi:hypothetical protein
MQVKQCDKRQVLAFGNRSKTRQSCNLFYPWLANYLIILRAFLDIDTALGMSQYITYDHFINKLQ